MDHNAQDCVPDLTMVIDPVGRGPDPEACPDWPLSRDDFNRAMRPPRPASDARTRLRAIGVVLHRGTVARVPTDAERAEARGRFFANEAKINWQWSALGFDGIRPAAGGQRQAAHLIVEAAHLRGYLRKVEAREGSAAKAKTDAEKASLQATVDAFPDTLAAYQARLAAVAVGEARHLQRLADEADARRSSDVRGQIEAIRAEAERAAAQLGCQTCPVGGGKLKTPTGRGLPSFL